MGVGFDYSVKCWINVVDQSNRGFHLFREKANRRSACEKIESQHAVFKDLEQIFVLS